MLWIALDFPLLPLESFRQISTCAEPWAVAAGADVLVCNGLAHAHGVRAGMRLSAACTLMPQLNYRLHDGTAEAAALESLATWAMQFTSNVSLEAPRTLLLDIEGSLRLFGGIRPILQTVKRDLDAMGHAATVACAPTATAALLLAHAGLQKLVHSRHGLEAAMATLPLAALDCDARTLQTLHAIGIKRVGELLALPRDGVARRFGQPLLDTIDRALGRLPAPRRFFAPPAHFAATVELAAPTASGAALLFAAQRLCVQLAGFLAARQGAIQHCTLTFVHERTDATRSEIGLLTPTRDSAHLMLLARERLAAMQLKASVHALRLEAADILVLAAQTRTLFPDPLGAQGEWKQLVERLRMRLGADAVHGLAVHGEHRPERASRVTQPGGTSGAPDCGPRPLWLLERPQPLGETAARPRYRDNALALVAGPERIESGWWDDDDVRRDYFVAQTPDHAMLWVYRERRPPGGWYLHGIFG